MLNVTINDTQQFELPKTWNELSGKQLIAIAPYFFKAEITLPERAIIAAHLCNFDYRFIQKNNDFLAQQIADKLLPATEFLYKEINLTAQLLPTIQVKEEFKFFNTITLTGPSSNFDNLTIAEFSDTETCLNNYQAAVKDSLSGEAELWLNRFIGILYRPAVKGVKESDANFKGDTRQPYNFYLNDLIAAMVKELSYGTRLAIMLWYLGCRAQLVSDYQFLFAANNKKAASQGSWTDVIHGLSGPKFGTIEQTMAANLKVVLRELSILHIQAKELNPLT